MIYCEILFYGMTMEEHNAWLKEVMDSIQTEAFSWTKQSMAATMSHWNPLYPQSNEKAVRAMKMTELILSLGDATLALFSYCFTPLLSVGHSPDQTLMGKQIRKTLPTLEFAAAMYVTS